MESPQQVQHITETLYPKLTIKTRISHKQFELEDCIHSVTLVGWLLIKTSGSESRGQEEAACMRVLGLCDHYSDQDER